jgi:hypothetical protein
MSSLTLQANLFQEFQPIGGVRARSLDTLSFSWATKPVNNSKAPAIVISTCVVVFMEALYQKT